MCGSYLTCLQLPCPNQTFTHTYILYFDSKCTPMCYLLGQPILKLAEKSIPVGNEVDKFITDLDVSIEIQ